VLFRLITPAPTGSRSGNRVTAVRWAGLLRELGHRVKVARRYAGEPCDALIALHARKSHASIGRFHLARPDAPLLVALTGTDLYGDLPKSRPARLSLAWATYLIVLQPTAVASLPPALRIKARVIRQSARKPAGRAAPQRGEFRVCVLGHLRPLKDPFRPAMAARLMPASSRTRVVHLGRALTPGMATRARREMARNPRYRWLGEVGRQRALQILAGSRLLVLSSRMEGGANVLSEALAAGVPILASRIPGSVGVLGRGYPGFFPAGDTRCLARLLKRSEEDPRFIARLGFHCRRLAQAVRPAAEREAWRRLLREMSVAFPDPSRRARPRGARQVPAGGGS
jgi:putative glycosyltransferase (TIGR04348 family)